MANIMVVHIIYSRYNLLKHRSSSGLVEFFLIFQKGKEIPSLTKFHSYSKGMLPLEYFIDFANVWMVKLNGNCNLSVNLLLARANSAKHWLLDNFNGPMLCPKFHFCLYYLRTSSFSYLFYKNIVFKIRFLFDFSKQAPLHLDLSFFFYFTTRSFLK